MSRRRLALCIAFAAGCSEGSSPAVAGAGGLAQVTIERALAETLYDTIRFEAPLIAHDCAPPSGGVLLDAVAGASGLLLWIRPGDSALPGAYAYAPAGDTLTPRSAVASVRFVAQDAPRGLLVDSGSLEVVQREATLGALLRGVGLAMPGGMRVRVAADLEDVPAASDTVPCEIDR